MMHLLSITAKLKFEHLTGFISIHVHDVECFMDCALTDVQCADTWSLNADLSPSRDVNSTESPALL